jgi:plastocyanin
VTAKGFKSHTMTKGSFTVRFTRAGTFNYHCTIHGSEGMRGTISVH